MVLLKCMLSTFLPGSSREKPWRSFNLTQMLIPCRRHNLKLQMKECKLFLQEVPWLGHVIGEGVVNFDPSKVGLTVNKPEPTEKADFRPSRRDGHFSGPVLSKSGRNNSSPPKFMKRVVRPGLGGTANGRVGQVEGSYVLSARFAQI